MFIDFKNRKWQSVNRVFLILTIVSLIIFNFIDSQLLKYHFDYLVSHNRYRNYENILNIIIGLVIGILVANSIFEEKYVFKFSNFLIGCVLSIFTITLLFVFQNKLNFYSKIDFILKKKVENISRTSFIDDKYNTRIYRYIVEKDTLHYSNFQKNGNKDTLEHKEILNAEIYRSFISREYYIKY